MSIAQERPRSWTPQIILFSIILHAVVIYYIAVAFNIVPPIIPPEEKSIPITAVPYVPPTPEFRPEDIDKRPRFVPRPVDTPVASPVPPLPIPAQPPGNGSTADAGVIALNGTIAEGPASQARPVYPETALRKDVQGRVVLSITIMPDGTVRDVRVMNASPAGYFENSAVKAVKTWRYRPSNVTRTNVMVHIDYVLT
jgi:periplasmic protein TonB